MAAGGGGISGRSVWRGVVSGAIGGLAGSVVMKALMVGARRLEGDGREAGLDQGGPAHQVANKVAEAATGEGLSPEGRRVAGEVVHYLFGAAVGGFYGGLAEFWTWVRWGSGTLYGVGVFLGADELSMPMLGLVGKPTEESVGAQAQHLGVHVAYGVTTELVRGVVRRGL